MIAALFGIALAEPPRGAVDAGYSIGGGQTYGYVAILPAVARSPDASVSARVTLSDLRYSYGLGPETVDVTAPGVSAGPTFTWADRSFVLGVGVGLGARYVQRSDTPTATLEPDATLGGEVFWRPGGRGQIYAMTSFSAAETYLWARSGATVPIAGGAGPVRLALGGEATTGGTFATRFTGIGPVAELGLGDRWSVGARYAVPIGDATGGPGSLGITTHTSW